MDINDKAKSINDILKIETDLCLEAGGKYGEVYKNTLGFLSLLNNSMKANKREAKLFVLFYSQVKKHTMLALLSAVRRHHIQSMMNLRQVLESASNAAYGLAFPKSDYFVDKDNEGVLVVKKSLSKNRNKWVEDNFKDKSDFIKNTKDWINNSCAHSNFIYAMQNFSIEQDHFSVPLFDNFDTKYKKLKVVENNLWRIGNISLCVLELFYEVNKTVNYLTFTPDFLSNLEKYKETNLKIWTMLHPAHLGKPNSTA